MEKDLTYKVKCRSCSKITEMYFSTTNKVSYKEFESWAHHHAQFPIIKQCDCDNGSMMFHDMVSYTIMF